MKKIISILLTAIIVTACSKTEVPATVPRQVTPYFTATSEYTPMTPTVMPFPTPNLPPKSYTTIESLLVESLPSGIYDEPPYGTGTGIAYLTTNEIVEFKYSFKAYYSLNRTDGIVIELNFETPYVRHVAYHFSGEGNNAITMYDFDNGESTRISDFFILSRNDQISLYAALGTLKELNEQVPKIKGISA